MQSRVGAARSHSATAGRRYAPGTLGLGKSVLGDVTGARDNLQGDVKSGYNVSTGVLDGAPPKRHSGDKRTSSHPDTPTETQREHKKAKTTYTPHQSKESGHYHVVLGADLTGTPEPERWKILDLVGEGTFAKVVEVWDRKRKVYVAVKIVRAIEKYVRDAKFEINMLHKIREDDRLDFYPTIKYRSYFFAGSPAGEHMCIVFPKLGFCLLDYLTRCSTFKLQEVAHITWQMGAALNYLHAHLRLIHTDLKPENILLEHPCETIDKVGNRTYTLPANTKIRLIDFGGASDEKHSKNSVVSTRHYRAPEVVLGQGWMWAADIWSTGCILLELHTGKLLYDTHDNAEHLAMMEKTLGRMPSFYADVSSQEARDKFFTRSGQLDTTWLSGTDNDAVKARGKIGRMHSIAHTIMDSDFLDLVTKCLEFDKAKRIRAHDLMYHPFVLKYWPEARRENEQREAYEQTSYGHILGASGSRTRVQDPSYARPQDSAYEARARTGYSGSRSLHP
eukprot:TRINITY_DN13_c0_g3_i1.p1 TRINITY_DN13_c0_g3~~TRINITY_DN13_c0_g3_i1.p1  ORF type:complete len:531 (+),score=185.92 TRINITY_DN13_c0_g3_i1:81-1595(+)